MSRLFGKKVYTSIRSYDTCNNFPNDWLVEKRTKVTVYYFLFISVYIKEENL